MTYFAQQVLWPLSTQVRELSQSCWEALSPVLALPGPNEGHSLSAFCSVPLYSTTWTVS